MRLRVAACTLALVLGMVGLAQAEESGNWFTRMMPSFGKKDEKDKTPTADAEDTKRAISAANRVKQAKADLERRQEVCLKLREIAIETNDDDLLRKADQLNERAWDLYVAAANASRSERPIGELSRKDLGLDKKGGKK